jgi:hypothetical protein
VFIVSPFCNVLQSRKPQQFPGTFNLVAPQGFNVYAADRRELYPLCADCGFVIVFCFKNRTANGEFSPFRPLVSSEEWAGRLILLRKTEFGV